MSFQFATVVQSIEHIDGWMLKEHIKQNDSNAKEPFISSEVEYNLGFRQRGLFEVVCNAIMYMLNSLVAKHLHVCGIILNPHLTWNNVVKRLCGANRAFPYTYIFQCAVILIIQNASIELLLNGIFSNWTLLNIILWDIGDLTFCIVTINLTSDKLIFRQVDLKIGHVYLTDKWWQI